MQGGDDEAQHDEEWQPDLKNAEHVILNIGLVRHLLHVEVQVVKVGVGGLNVDYGAAHEVLQRQESSAVIIC